jgi:GTP-binding protein Era
LGVKTTGQGQIVFFDSPGIHKPFFKLNEKMMKEVHNSLHDADLILYFVDLGDRGKDEFILTMLNDIKKPVFLIINKVDKFAKVRILKKIDEFKDYYHWNEIVPISALQGDNVALLEKLIFQYLPENDYFYPDETYTLQSERYFVSELIREKLLQLTKEELPFVTTVKVEEIEDRKKESTGEDVIYIRAEIYVETQSQKKIVVGKHGDLIKNIGQLARQDLEDYFDGKVFLDLYVKVQPNWRNSPFVLNDMFD